MFCFFLLDFSGCLNRYALVQYWFEGPEVEVKPKPHGNSKSSHPYFLTAESAKAHLKAMAKSETPKSIMQIATQEHGGEIGAKGLNKIPRNLQQLKNYRRNEKKDTNVLYSVMLQCKVCEGKSEAFVRDVKAAPEPQCVLFSDWQISDLERFLTGHGEYSILTADTTYNLGDFYVTPTTYQHLLLEDVATGKHPTFLGPVLIHQRKNFSAFNYFASTLVGHSKKLQEIRAFGTDGDIALVDALAHNFPSAKHLRCFLHLKRNIAEKLKERGFPSAVSDEFLADIFGKHTGSVYEEGLVDANNGEDFDVRLSKCRKVWQTQESPYLRSGQSFFEYFKKYYANIVRFNMLKDLRIAVGLGNPPAIFTTNSSESINAVVKRKVNFKETEWPKFNQQLKQIVNEMHEEGIRALSGRGCYRLCKLYKHLQVDPSRWVQMTADQRRALVKRFDLAPLQVSKIGEQQGEASFSGEGDQSFTGGAQAGPAISTAPKLSVTAENSGIQTLTFETVRCIWVKAEEYLKSKSDVVPAPGSSKSMMVASRSSKAPHFVCAGPNGQYSCDNGCLQWKSSQICAHVIAAAQKNHELLKFLKWYNSSDQGPNITMLAMSELPSGRGRKGGVPKRKRSVGVRQDPELTVQRPAFREHRSRLSSSHGYDSQLPSSQLSASGGQGSQLPASHGRASQLPASHGQGSQLPASHGRASQLPASHGQGSQLPASCGRTSQLPASGSQLPASGSQLPASHARSGSQLPASGSQLPASGSQLPASGS